MSSLSRLLLRFCCVLQPFSIRGLATLSTYFLHLSLSSVILIDSPTVSPVHVLMLSSPSPTHSFIPGLKPSFSANPSHRSLSFFFFRIHYMNSSDCLPLLLRTSVCIFLNFFSVLHFSVVGSVLWIKLTYVGFRAHVKIASRIVSYRIVSCPSRPCVVFLASCT